MKIKESVLMKKIQVLSTKLGSRLFRNNVGTGWAGNAIVINKPQSVQLNPGDVVVRNARPLRAGLCEGSSDLIGWTPVTVKQEMVGKSVAIFTACEVKSEKGKITDRQKNFIETIKNSGGIGFISRSENDLIEELEF